MSQTVINPSSFKAQQRGGNTLLSFQFPDGIKIEDLTVQTVEVLLPPEMAEELLECLFQGTRREEG